MTKGPLTEEFQERLYSVVKDYIDAEPVMVASCLTGTLAAALRKIPKDERMGHALLAIGFIGGDDEIIEPCEDYEMRRLKP